MKRLLSLIASLIAFVWLGKLIRFILEPDYVKPVRRHSGEPEKYDNWMWIKTE